MQELEQRGKKLKQNDTPPRNAWRLDRKGQVS